MNDSNERVFLDHETLDLTPDDQAAEAVVPPPPQKHSPPPVALHATVSATRWAGDTDLEAQKRDVEREKRSWPNTLWLAYSAIGVVYGDIGTSPLYVFSSTFTEAAPTPDDVLGAMSIIFWILTLVVVVKYLLVVLLADDHGEGGTFALYSLLCRRANITPANKGAPDASDLQLSRYSSSRAGGPMTRRAMAAPAPSSPRIHPHASAVEAWLPGNGPATAVTLRRLLAGSPLLRQALLSLVLLMTAMLLGDGVLTPAQSVLGAIYGLQVKAPSVSTGAIVGITCAILILLFLAQRLGTTRLGFSFSPIVLVFFAFNIIIAGYNINKFQRGIFRALSPHYIYLFFKHNRHTGWVQLAGLFLAITGTEALFADLGHFNRRAVQLSFLSVAYPALVITYLGQAAWLMDPDNAQNVGSTFYASIPTAWGNGFYWPVFLSAVGASVVASQAIISAAFSLIKQSIQLGCFPRLTVIQVSKRASGSIYIPEVNYVMMILTVVVVAIFKNTTKLGNAYGVAVSSTMLGTTFLIVLVIILDWELGIWPALAFLLIFGFIDGVFWSTNLNKIPQGGWFAVAISVGVFAASYLWWWGTDVKRRRIAATQVRLQDLFETQPAGSQEEESGRLLERATGQQLVRLPSAALVYAETLYGAPLLLPHLVSRWSALHGTVVIVTVRQVAVPSVLDSERILFRKLPYPGMYRCVVRYGYRERVVHDVPFAQHLLGRVAQADPQRAKEMAAVRPQTISFLVSHAELVSAQQPAEGRSMLAKGAGMLRRFCLDTLYHTMSRFATKSWEGWSIPRDQLFEVGVAVKA